MDNDTSASRGALVSELARCLPWIERAIKRSGKIDTMSDVVDRIFKGHAQFWPAPNGCLVTEIVDHAERRGIRVWLAGGELGQVLDMEGDVAQWAKSQGCTFAEFDGRRGWQRRLEKRGWKPRSIVMELDLGGF